MKKYFIVDYRTSKEELNNLSNYCDNIILCPKHKMLYAAIDGHVDIQLHKISENTVILHRDMDSSFIDELKNLNFSVIKSEFSLKDKYPNNIHLNALNFGKFFVHNLRYSDPNLLNLVKDKELIDVKQGYTKCSCLNILEHAVITNDKGIHKSLSNFNIDCLRVPYGDILLPGLNYGFIGGTCGFIDKNTLGFFGSLDKYLYSDMIKDFLYKYDIKYVSLSTGKLNDRGSIFSFEF